MARGYGIANYGDGYWGQTKYVDAAATASVSASGTSTGNRVQSTSGSLAASASISSAGQRIKLGLAQKDCTSTATASANFTTNASAAVSPQVSVTTGGVRVQFSTSIVVPTATIVTSCERVRLASSQEIQGEAYTAPVATIVTAGGSSNISMSVSLTADAARTRNVDAATATSVTTSSAAKIVKDAEASPAASVTATSAANIDAAGVATVSGSVSHTVSSNITAKGVAEVDGIASLTSLCERIRGSNSQSSAVVTFTASAREMWEPVSLPTHTWVELNDNATTWQEIA